MDENNVILNDKQGRIPKKDDHYRDYLLVLYKDSEIYDYEEVINTIKGWCRYYAYIEHLPEKNETKAHTHVILHWDSPKYPMTLENKLGVPMHYFQIPLSNRGSRRYLTHIDFPEKIQYNIQDVVISKSFIQKFMSAYDDEMLDIDMLNLIYEFIDNEIKLGHQIVDIEKNLSLYVCSANFSRIFKTYYNTIISYIRQKV